jgi:hypothetical protein
MKGPSYQERIWTMMRETGRSYHECCRILGQRGGRAAASRRRSRAWEAKKQEAQGLR